MLIAHLISTLTFSNYLLARYQVLEGIESGLSDLWVKAMFQQYVEKVCSMLQRGLGFYEAECTDLLSFQSSKDV